MKSLFGLGLCCLICCGAATQASEQSAPAAAADSAPANAYIAQKAPLAFPATPEPAASLRIGATAAAPDALPPYEFPYSDGLYASAAGYLSIKNVCLPCQKTVLLDVPGFCARFPVRAVLQDSAAPLVVVLLGIEGRADDDFSKLWPSWYAAAGYHVLTFDSTFSQDFNSRSHHGVTGNVWAETELAAKIIQSFLAQSNMNGRVTQVGVVGMSYGAVEALMLGTMAGAKKLPFEIHAIQAFSPPISMSHSAAIIDGWYTETYGKYTLVELLELQKMQPDRNCPEPRISQCMLKAAAAASFRMPLPGLIAYNDQAYCLHQLPKGDEFDDAYVRTDHAGRWGFMKFAYGMSYPYWMHKLNAPDLDGLVHAADLAVLLAHQPPGSEIILAEDDPLDTPADMQAFKAQSAGKRVTVLPRGGHLGYINEPWTRAKLMTLFK